MAEEVIRATVTFVAGYTLWVMVTTLIINDCAKCPATGQKIKKSRR
jgi:hypothetical protein